MKPAICPLALFLAFAATASASVIVSSPSNNSTVNSSVTYTATGTSSCVTGIAAMGVYVNNLLVVKQSGASLNAVVPLGNGYYSTVVQQWDNCGGSDTTPINITVGPGSTSTSTGVTVSSPANNSTVKSPAVFAASATTATCPQGLAAMGVYIDNTLQYSTNGPSIQTSLALANGQHQAVIQAWDNCGGAFNTPLLITVGTSPTNGTTGINVSSPANNSTVASPVAFSANATTATCGKGIAAIGVYVDNTLSYTANGSSLQTPLALSGGQHQVVLQAWDNCGGAFNTPLGLDVQVTAVSISASPLSITTGGSSVLNVTASNAAQVTITGSDGSTYMLPQNGGTQTVSPAADTTYTAKATQANSSVVTSSTSVSVMSSAGLSKINHVIFMLQENHSFDNYFGMLNPYRSANNFNLGADGNAYMVDGIDDKLLKISNTNDEGAVFPLFKLASTCVDDMTSSWLESYGQVNRYDFSNTRAYPMDGFVHTAENFAKDCAAPGSGCSGTFNDLAGRRAMGYYDQRFLNYYYYMASQFALSDRWFSPLSSKSIPNRIATFSGGATQGLAFDPGSNDHLPQLGLSTIFSELDQAKVSWKIYYTTTEGGCTAGSLCGAGLSQFPDTVFTYFGYANQYLYQNPNGSTCAAPTQPSSVVGDTSNAFCIDPTRIAPLSAYYSDLKDRTLPSFSFIESGAGHDDEHPGSGQSVLTGQQGVASIVNSLMTSPSWGDSAFFLAYDEGGGPYDHVPPVSGHSNQNTNPTVGSTDIKNISDVASISINADQYRPCVSPGGVASLHCDLPSVNDPGGHSTDAPAQQGFAAQIGWRVPNMIISPFTRRHYVGHTPMDHTAVLKFVENRFIGPSAHLTPRDAAQPSLLDFFDFSGTPWLTPPTPPTPASPQTLGYDPCTPKNF